MIHPVPLKAECYSQYVNRTSHPPIDRILSDGIHVGPMNAEDMSRSIGPIAERYGVDRIYLSNRINDDGRIELSMESGKLVSMRDIFEFTDELEGLFGTRVRIVDRESTRNRELLRTMMEDETLIYEWEGLKNDR